MSLYHNITLSQYHNITAQVQPILACSYNYQDFSLNETISLVHRTPKKVHTTAKVGSLRGNCEKHLATPKKVHTTATVGSLGNYRTTATVGSSNHSYFGGYNCHRWQFYGHNLKLPYVAGGPKCIVYLHSDLYSV